jgi:hypothetical protein
VKSGLWTRFALHTTETRESRDFAGLVIKPLSVDELISRTIINLASSNICPGRAPKSLHLLEITMALRSTNDGSIFGRFSSESIKLFSNRRKSSPTKPEGSPDPGGPPLSDNSHPNIKAEPDLENPLSQTPRYSSALAPHWVHSF